MRKITKIKRSIRAISPVISVLLMIAIAVVAALVAYAWIMGYINFNTSISGKAIQIQSITKDQTNHLVAYVQNTGQGTVILDTGYVNDNQVAQLLNIQLDQGATGTVVTDYVVTSSDSLTVKIVTTDGTYSIFTGSISGGTIETFQVTFNYGTGGASITPSGTQSYTSGTSISVRATAASGYQFSSWTSTGGITFESSNSATTTAHLDSAGTVTATFVQIASGQTYAVTFGKNGGGSSSTISPTGTINYLGGSSVTITAVAGSGYQFSSWTSTGSISFDYSTSAQTIAHVNSEGSITANFVASQPSQDYQVSWILGEGGSSVSPTGTQTYTGGSAVSIYAIPASGYQFSYWLSSTTSGSITFDSTTSASTTAHINGQGTVTAYFTQITPGQNYQVTFSTNGGGTSSSTTPSGTQTYAPGATVPINAIAGSGYQFSSWSTTGSISFDSSTSASTNAHINGEGSIIANFIVSQPSQYYQVTFILGTGGSSMNPNSPQNYAGGSSVPINAVAASGYQFYSWTSTGSISFDSATSSSTNAHVNSEGSITANFIANQPGQNYQVTFSTNGGGTSSSTTPSGTQTYTPGATVPISATAGSGYQFSSWTFNGNLDIDNPASATTSVVVNSAGTITANFIQSNSYKLVFTYGASQTLLIEQPSQAITIQRQESDGDAYRPASSLTVSLTATSGNFYSDPECTHQTTTATIDSGRSTTSFYYKSASVGTPTLTASATSIYQPDSTTFTIIAASSQTPISTTNFDGSNWEEGWSFWGNPPWDYTTTTYLSAPRSVYSNSGNQGAFSCDRLAAADNALYVTVTFDFKLVQTEPTDFQLRYSGNRTDVFEQIVWSTAASNLGDRTTYSADWNHVTINIYDSAAFTDYFRIQFYTQGLTSGEAVYVDNVQVVMYY